MSAHTDPGKESQSPLKPGTTLLALVGPTALGKTAVAVEVARGIPTEIISVDSMQVYRGMDIGTAKPTPEEMGGVTFHMIDITDPHQDLTVALFKEIADSVAVEIISRGGLPFLVGGSGLYYRAVVDDLDFAHAFGERWNRQEARGMNDIELHQLLRKVDPKAAEEIPPGNIRRVLRALEVARQGDRLVSQRQSSWSEYHSPYRLVVAGLEADRALLYRLIDERVDRMVSLGLEGEVRDLTGKGLAQGTTAGEALGYKQMLDFLNGNTTIGGAIDEIKRRTRNYAKRQMTWFKRDPRVKWFRVACSSSDTAEVVDKSQKDATRRVLEYMLDKLEN